MQTIQSLDELNIPQDYKTCISDFLQNLADIPYISRVILFGGCAKEQVHKHSDIDIFITSSRELSLDEELYILGECHPESALGNKSLDIIVQPEETFFKNINSFGMVQKQVYKHGVDISEPLRQRAGAGTSRFVLD